MSSAAACPCFAAGPCFGAGERSRGACTVHPLQAPQPEAPPAAFFLRGWPATLPACVCSVAARYD
jgi:hypothetical protein